MTLSWTFALALILAAQLSERARPKGEVTLTGSIESIERHQCSTCNCTEVDVSLKTVDGRVHVKLGPQSFLEQRDFALFRGDLIVVTGFRFKEKGNWTMLANEVRKGGDTLILRGKHGKPEWLEKHGHTCPVCAN